MADDDRIGGKASVNAGADAGGGELPRDHAISRDQSDAEASVWILCLTGGNTHSGVAS
jgi:hypothetical protein